MNESHSMKERKKEKESCFMPIPFALQILNYLQPFVVGLCVFVWVGLEGEQRDAQR